MCSGKTDNKYKIHLDDCCFYSIVYIAWYSTNCDDPHSWIIGLFPTDWCIYMLFAIVRAKRVYRVISWYFAQYIRFSFHWRSNARGSIPTDQLSSKIASKRITKTGNAYMIHWDMVLELNILSPKHLKFLFYSHNLRLLICRIIFI